MRIYEEQLQLRLLFIICIIWLIREHNGEVIGREALDTRDKLVRFSDVLAGTIFYVPVGHWFLFDFEQDFHYKYGFFTAFLFQIFTLIFRYKNCKQRLHVHLGNREYRSLLLGQPQTPSYRKQNTTFEILKYVVFLL
jgi:hypothetical protein